MAHSSFEDRVEIQGSQDTPQLQVQGNVTQNQPLQVWQDSALDDMAQVAADGTLKVGDLELLDSTRDALVEAHRDSTSTKPKRGWHSLGRIGIVLGEIINWAVHELELLGTNGISGLQTALRVRLTNDNTGSAANAEMRAGDFQAINKRGSIGTAVGRMTGIRGAANNTQNAVLANAAGVEASIQNDIGATITQAAALDVVLPINAGTIETLYGLRVADLSQVQGTVNDTYAIHTGRGTVHLGDVLEVEVPAATPDDPPTNVIRIYTKTDGKLYARNSGGQEFDLTGGGGGGGTSAFAEGENSIGTIFDGPGAVSLDFSEPNHNNLNFFDPLFPDQLTAPVVGLYLFTAHIAVNSVDPNGNVLDGKVQVSGLGIDEFSIAVNQFTHIHYCASEFEDFTVTGSWYADEIGRAFKLAFINNTSFHIDGCFHWAMAKIG